MKNRRLSEPEMIEFKKLFPISENAWMADHFRLDENHVKYLAKKRKLHKSPKFVSRKRRLAANISHEVRKKNKK